MTSASPQGPPPAPPGNPGGEKVSPALAALRGQCPQCGAKTLFSGVASFAPRCRACGLDYSSFNVGDGPAPFLIFLVGGLVVLLAILLELKVGPPFWVHILLWVPLTAVLVVGGLRFSKGLLLILEYRNRAREGRIVGGE
ncbi:MAG TPA: DUF983 domain-containing protein [Allosphingosinicella sp.]|jgi:uncharacterized protein (DUF983 family)